MTGASDPRAVAINVAANTQLPGVRGPIGPDGRFEYVPIPEREPTDGPVPTYADLDLAVDLPPDLSDRRVHLDPEFAGVHGRTAYTYGDEHGVKAGPLSALDPGDCLLFYATLSFRAGFGGPASAEGPGASAAERTKTSAAGEGTEPAADNPARAPFVLPDWGAYLLGEFRVAAAVTGEAFRDLPAAERERFASNAHLQRETVDAKVLVRGDDRSRLYDRAVPLSATTGSEANWLVTDLSSDSGKGPWWRRVLRFDPAATAELRRVVDDPARVVTDERFGAA
ncbi:MAG: hypothetical protein ABEH78_07205 [Haloferacaceae archaeon]